ncbi:hypothetical protein [uncultured Desulfovibrio sp.]|uniref:hypothetical protein n=1 Tax=uncultured Desulfovibrio sp. TaxID=167968 RepID=UPI002612BA6A|nr:hypothetical protein [uncultured Desulfovibrio sp.]
MVEYMLLWIVCGIGAAAIAARQKAEMISTGSDESIRKCPYCAEQILKEARVCKHCG